MKTLIALKTDHAALVMENRQHPDPEIAKQIAELEHDISTLEGSPEPVKHHKKKGKR